MATLLRIVGGVALALLVWQIDVGLAGHPSALDLRGAIVATVAGFVLGLLLTPDLTLKPLLRLRDRVEESPDEVIAGTLTGVLLGLIFTALLAYPVSLLPAPFGRYAPAAIGLVTIYVCGSLGMSRGSLVLHRLGFVEPPVPTSPSAVVDTSVIIDGRLAAIRTAGFLPFRLIVPNFVVDELQKLADSSNATVRARGRRGLDALLDLQRNDPNGVELMTFPESGGEEVDQRLLAAAKVNGRSLLTNDTNLARIAQLHRVPVLSLHALALATRQQFNPGDTTRVRVVSEGSEPNQGRAYLPDGTLIVVDGGRRFVGSEVDITIDRSVQTGQGKLLFAKPVAEEKERVS